LEIVDHLGPTAEVIEEYSIERSGVPGSYVVVSDFMMGGTEIKIAREHARRRGSRLAGICVIGALLPPEDYQLGVPVEPLVSLPECAPAGVKFTLLD
jgi:hypothetical protein